MKVNIYCLYDPIECKIRYIGRTRKDLNNRLAEHLSKTKYCHLYYPNKRLSHKENWIKSILSQNREPKIKKLTEIEGWQESYLYEIGLIEKYKKKNNLTNSKDLGYGHVGYIPDEVSRLKISNSLKSYYENNDNIACKPVEVFNLLGEKIYDCKSLAEASKLCNIHISGVERCLSKKHRQCKGYQFKYKNNNITIESFKKVKKDNYYLLKNIKVINLINNQEEIYFGINLVEEKLKLPKGSVRQTIYKSKSGIYKNKYKFEIIPKPV